LAEPWGEGSFFLDAIQFPAGGFTLDLPATFHHACGGKND